MRLDHGAAERLVLAAARDHFYAADNLEAPGVASAQRCLALLPDSALARAENDAIAALLRLHREHKYAMLPAAFKQVRPTLTHLGSRKKLRMLLRMHQQHAEPADSSDEQHDPFAAITISDKGLWSV